MPCVGVDISDTSMKYVSFEPTTLNTAEKKIKQQKSRDFIQKIINEGWEV
jgi:hypothetical protein